MTELYIAAKINDGETGELIEKVAFIYCVPQSVDDLEDLTPAQIEKIESEIERRRDYESENGDIYRVDLIVLKDVEEHEDEDEEEE